MSWKARKVPSSWSLTTDNSCQASVWMSNKPHVWEAIWNIKRKKENTTVTMLSSKGEKTNTKTLTSSWSCIWGSSLTYGPRRAAQKSHSPHLPRRPGPRTQKKSILKTSHSQHGRETLHQLPPLRLVSGRAAHAHYALPKYSKHTELQMQIEADTDCMHSWVQEYLRKDMILFDFFASVRQHSGCEI